MILDEFKTPEEFLQNIGNAQLVSRRSPFWVHIATKLIKPYTKKKTGK
jgi:hypothetical protein